MGFRKTIFTCSLLAVLQVVATLGFVKAGASAQAGQLVAVVTGEKSREACEVQSRRSDDGNWGAQSLDGPPVACEGGLVTALIMTQEEATQEIARTEIAAESVEISVVTLTGDPIADEAAILAEMDVIHEVFAPDVSAEEESLGYMAPDALHSFLLGRTAPSSAVLAANCNTGRVGQWRRRDTRWRSPDTQAVARAHIVYKRISCARWRITAVQMTLVEPPNHDRVWFRNFYYNRAWLGSAYGDRQAGKQCWSLLEDEWTTFRPNWDIQAGGSAQIEAIDANPNVPDVNPSCQLGAGRSFNSFKIYLPGGRS